MRSPHRFFALSVSLTLIAIVGAIDYLTGYEISVSILYYIPIAYAGWYLGLAAGLASSLICVGTMGWAELADGYRYGSDWLLAQEAGQRLLGFFFVAFSFSFMRRVHDRNRLRISQLGEMVTFCSCCHDLCDTAGTWIRLGKTPLDPAMRSRAKLCPTCARSEYVANTRREA